MDIAGSIFRPVFDVYKWVYGSRMASRKLKSMAHGKEGNIEQLMDVAFSFEYKGNFPKAWSISVAPVQNKPEIQGLLRIVKDLNPKVIVEIGTARGGTLFLFANVTGAEKIISCDLPGGAFGGGYPYWLVPLYKSLGKKGVIDLLRADSHNSRTFEKMKALLAGREIDFLFIDGDHTYEGVKQDFQTYSPLVRKGGVVAFHDVVEHDLSHDPTGTCKVDVFWREIKQNYRNKEILVEENQKCAGIGVLYL